ncbi:MAG: response regulator [Candidatus Bathyarchaeota archaeon]|nr:response regulator [Candidatus Bathyarchaeum sp.]
MKIRILYIEDNPDDQLILKRSLKEKLSINYDLVIVDTATKGLAKIQKEDFDLILMDYRLPDMTGIDFVRQLKKTGNKAPIILLTGKGNENIAVEAMKLGVRDYIIKEEVKSQRLIDSITDILLESSLPETINLETAKALVTLFNKNPIVRIDSISTLTSNPKTEIPTEELVATLKTLTELDIVNAEPSRSVITCPDCESLTSTLYIECPECESTKMTKEEALEHFDCGNIDFRTKFSKGEGSLVCPKCGKKLKVIGVDYRKIENWYRCSNNHFFGQPNFSFACSKCTAKFNLETANLEMLHNYSLTKTGRQNLQLGLKTTGLTEKSQDKQSSQKM